MLQNYVEKHYPLY